MADKTYAAPPVEAVELTPEEYAQAKRAALRSVGLTYRQLEREARAGEFSSPRAHKIWVAIGGHAR